MALSSNAQAKEQEIDISRVRSSDDDDGGIAYGRRLSEFVDAFMTRDPDQLANARNMLVETMGADGMVEAASVAGNFQRMVRIADSIGIPIDESRVEMSEELREQLGLNEFHSAQNTLNRT
jgi:hypothetical protein